MPLTPTDPFQGPSLWCYLITVTTWCSVFQGDLMWVGEDTVQTRAPRLCSCLFTVIKSHFIQQVLLDILWSIFFLHLCDFRSITIVLHSVIPESVHFIKQEDASKFKIIIWFYIIHLYCLRKASNIIVGSPNVCIFSVQIFNLFLSV